MIQTKRKELTGYTYVAFTKHNIYNQSCINQNCIN